MPGVRVDDRCDDSERERCMSFDALTLAQLKPGDVIESGKLMPGISSEPLLWELVEVHKEASVVRMTFRLSWMGVFVSQMIAMLTQDANGIDVEWRKPSGSLKTAEG